VREKAVLMVQSDPHTRAKGPEHIAAYNWMQDYAAKVIAERRARPLNDLISHFSMAEIDGDRLDEREVLLTTTTLIMAGVESLGGFMSMFALNLADHADARRAWWPTPRCCPTRSRSRLRFNTSAQRFRRCLQRTWNCTARRCAPATSSAWPTARATATSASTPIPTATTSAQAAWPPGLRRRRARLPGHGHRAAVGEDRLRRVPQGGARLPARAGTLPWMPSSTFRSPTRLELAAQ
jgi:hypothetical protein